MPTRSPFPRVTPESQGVDSAAILAFVDAIEAQRLGLHSFMLLRGGALLAEAWWQPFTPDIPHIMYSLTKSFTSTAVGFAVNEGRLSVDDTVISFFPRLAPRQPSENLRRLRVRHLLTMTVGHDADPTGDLRSLEPADWLPAFFEAPIPHAPGTHFVYNSAASNVLSAIVQKVTGQKLITYLMPRLFRPLGISRPLWDTDPAGRNWGGWGLFLRTEDIARFGQTLLNRGAWQGQQVIPAEWLAEATRKQVPNGNDPNSDWAQGYGFQFWMSRHGFRGDGAFGQFCVVLPEYDTLLVTTAGAPEMQPILNAAWATLLPGLHDAALPENPVELAGLRERLNNLAVARPAGASVSAREGEFLGRVYRLDANPKGWESIVARREGAALIVTLQTPDGPRELRCGTAKWETGAVQLEMPFPLAYAGAAAWKDDATLKIHARYLVPGSLRRLTLQFNGDEIELITAHTGILAPPDEVAVMGRLAS